MIAAVRGTLEGKTNDSALVAVGGVVLRVLAPSSTLATLALGQPVRLETFLLVREDLLALFGFATSDDREVFEQLLQVGGVGPSIALALLSTMPAHAFREAVLSDDVARIALTPRVGKKLAARLVLELRPRFEKLGLTAPTPAPGATPTGGVQTQVVEALTGLGYSPAEAAAAVRAIPVEGSATLEDLILRALRLLANE